MARFAEPMSRLIDELRKLPGIGTKSAQRLAFHVLRSTDADARALADAILVLRERLRLCSVCNNITDVDPVQLLHKSRFAITISCAWSKSRRTLRPSRRRAATTASTTFCMALCRPSAAWGRSSFALQIC